MSENKHTPGEFSGWKIGTEFACHTQILDAEGHLVVTTACDYRRAELGQESYEAHEFRLSRLLLAAPDMLAALELVNPLLMKLCTVAMNPAVKAEMPFGLIDEVREWLKDNKAQAAIKKARGQQ